MYHTVSYFSCIWEKTTHFKVQDRHPYLEDIRGHLKVGFWTTLGGRRFNCPMSESFLNHFVLRSKRQHMLDEIYFKQSACFFSSILPNNSGIPSDKQSDVSWKSIDSVDDFQIFSTCWMFTMSIYRSLPVKSFLRSMRWAPPKGSGSFHGWWSCCQGRNARTERKQRNGWMCVAMQKNIKRWLAVQFIAIDLLLVKEYILKKMMLHIGRDCFFWQRQSMTWTWAL